MMEGGWGVEEVGVEEWDAISAVLQTHERQAVPSPASASAVAGSTPAATSHSISVSTSGSGVAPPVQTKARGGGEDGKLPGLGGLEDRLKVGLDLVIVGDNPGLASAGSGHHYAHPSNHFWRLLHESGLLPVPLSPSEDTKITSYGVRILLIELSSNELNDGLQLLKQKLAQYQPMCICFNGKQIFEALTKRKCQVGYQGNDCIIKGLPVWVMPSTSARVKMYSYDDKLALLRRLRIHMAEEKRKKSGS